MSARSAGGDAVLLRGCGRAGGRGSRRLASMRLAVGRALDVGERVSFRTDDGVTSPARGTSLVAARACGHLRPHAAEVPARLGGLAAQRQPKASAGWPSISAVTADSPGSPQDYAGMVQDVRAARRFLSSRSDVTPARIGDRGRVDRRRRSRRWRRPTIRRSSASRCCRPRSTTAVFASTPPSRSPAPGPFCSSRATTMAMRCGRCGSCEKAGGGRPGSRRAQPRRPRHGDADGAIPNLGRRLLEWFRQTLL